MGNESNNNLTTSVASWRSDEQYVAQAMESSMYASAHADDTLVLIGPARMPSNPNDLKPVGILQNFSIQQGRSVVPHQAIGSARTFFQSSKVSVSGNIGRLFVNGKNLHRALYDNFYNANEYLLKDSAAGGKSPLPHAPGNENFLVNLDSRLFLIPFGMAVVYRDKLQNTIGAIYVEMMVIPNWSSNIAAGSPTLIEGTSFLADRVLPFAVPSGVGAYTDNKTFNENLAAGDKGLAARLNSILIEK